MKKGIKALGMNMEAIKGNRMIYEMNKEYTHNGHIKCGDKGYHYFDSIRDAMVLFNFENHRLFECELNGDKFEHDGIIHCTNKIKLIREITKEEINKYIEDNLDKLVNDKDIDVRREVAKHGYGLDKLINDEHWYVRKEVARYGYGLDILVNDEDWFVREEVAKQGYGLDKLVNDKDWRVRLETARQGYGLDKLVNDKVWIVRCEVAKQGYGLDKLINDEDGDVRKEVLKQLKLRKNKEN